MTVKQWRSEEERARIRAANEALVRARTIGFVVAVVLSVLCLLALALMVWP